MFHYAFDLIELNGDDLRREPLAVRKATLASVLAAWASGTTSIWNSMTVRPCSTTPASLAWKASCRSGRNSEPILAADHPHDLARLQCCSAMDLQSIIRNCPANDIGPITLKELPTSLATGWVLASVLFKPKLP